MSTKAYHGFHMPERRDSASSVFEMVVYPELAARFLQDFKWDRQRNPKNGTISMYAKLMERGEYKKNTLLRIAWNWRKDEMYLLDGQHRLSAQTIANVPMRYAVSIESVADETEAAEIYATIDRNAIRTGYDQFHALGIDSDYGWSKNMTNAAVSSIRFLAGDFLAVPKGITLQTQLDLIAKYAPTASVWMDFVFEHTDGVGVDSRIGLRRDVMAVGIVTFFYSAKVYGQSRVEEFWSGSLSGEMLVKGDPRLPAHSHMLSTYLAGGGAVQKNVEPVYLSARKISNFFNAWIRGDTRLYTRVKDASAPMLIMGSPWDGKSIHVEKTLWNNL